jgi:hypothetical protein
MSIGDWDRMDLAAMAACCHGVRDMRDSMIPAVSI